MNLIETLMGESGRTVVDSLAARFGVTAEQASAAVSTIAPAFAGGLKAKVDAGGGAGLLDLLSDGSLTKFAADPSELATPAALETGRNLLGQLFGGGDLTGLASGLSEKSGVGTATIQSMLPILATAFFGFLSKKAAGKSTSEIADLLGTLSGEGGGMMDNLKSMAAKIFGS